jgi:hypothetical protein
MIYPYAKPLETNFTKLDIVMPCKVSYVDDNEKVGKNYGHHVTIEYNQMLKMMSYYLPDQLDKDEEFKRYLR